MNEPETDTTVAHPAGHAAEAEPHDNRRQALYWRLLARLFDPEEQAALESASLAVVEDIGLPPALLDPGASVDSIVQRHPELAAEFDGLMVPGPGRDGDADETRDRPAEVRRAALVSKVLLNVFSTGTGAVSAGQLARWQSDAGWLERALGCAPGDLRGGRAGGGRGAGPTGTGGNGGTPDLSRLIPRIGPELGALEGDLVKRMHLREVLADPTLAARLTPSMSLIEQLLRDKNNLSGVALANAKALIRRFVDEVAEVLRTQVEKATVGAVDRSVPPKRVFRNLDLDRTIWKNLTKLQPGGGAALRRPPLLPAHRPQDDTPAARRGGGPVGLDGRLHGQLHHPRLRLRGTAQGRRPPHRVRHAGARPHPVGARPLRDPAAHPPGRRHRRHRRHGPGPAEDRRTAQHRRGVDLRLLRVAR
ncbi:hypothetical protein RKD18_007137 [Streptomyces phaeoluteigriseus]